LQRLFSTIQLGEREGSGGPAMRRAWEAQRFRVPRVWLDPEHSETHLELPLENLLPEWAIHEAEQRFGDRYREQNELGRLVIVTAIVEHEIGHARLAELGAAHTRDLTLKLQELMRKGVLGAKGNQRQKTYFAASVDSSGANGGISDASVDSSGASEGSSGGDGAGYDASSEPYDASSEPYDASSAVSRVRLSKRAAPELVQEAIRELCQERYLPLDVLADWLRRNRNTIRNLHIPKLVAARLLELRYPDSPTHPQQAYRTKQEPSP
jgi:ATP-dependent DNA helicase RecG